MGMWEWNGSAGRGGTAGVPGELPLGDHENEMLVLEVLAP
jgi:hypothetical protein